LPVWGIIADLIKCQSWLGVTVIQTNQYIFMATDPLSPSSPLVVMLQRSRFEVRCVEIQKIETIEAELQQALDCEMPFVLVVSDTFSGHAFEWHAIKAKYFDLPIILFGTQPKPEGLLMMLHHGVTDYFDINIVSPDYVTEALDRAFMLSSIHLEKRSYRKRLEEMLRVLKMDQEAGRCVQQKFFPEHNWSYQGVSFDYRIYPSLYLSGDFLDYYPIDDHQVAFYVADVSGHGSSSAFVTILLKNYIERLRRRFVLKMDAALQSPNQVLASLNRELCALSLGKHLAIFAGVIDTQSKKLSYSMAAQYPAPYLILEGGVVEVLDEKGGVPIGIFPSSTYPLYERALTDSFTLIILSDGILEVLEAEGIEAKESALRQKVIALKGHLVDIEKAYALNQRDTLPDDITLCVVQCQGLGHS